MSHALIDRSADLKRLRDDGYELEVRSNHLLVHSVPYVSDTQQVAFGTLVTELTMSGDITTRPATHVIHFAGSHPCTKDGHRIVQIKHASGARLLAVGLSIDHSFSNKPAAGYANYYEKVSRYVEIISSEAKAIAPFVDARTFKLIESEQADDVFAYLDTASSRAGITAVAQRLSSHKIGIIGLGGTGSYVLDLVAKTSVREIHLFDDDLYLQHNAFRSPGAASIEELRHQPSKVEHWRDVYARMRSGIVAHRVRINEATGHLLDGLHFVFVCVDGGPARKIILDLLRSRAIPFVDAGMGVELTDDLRLWAVCRVTAGTDGRTEHIGSRIPTAEAEVDAAYQQNIQIADLNALNAAMAVIKWKKIAGIYVDEDKEHHSTYSSNLHLLTSEERSA
jgi:ThiF family